MLCNLNLGIPASDQRVEHKIGFYCPETTDAVNCTWQVITLNLQTCHMLIMPYLYNFPLYSRPVTAVI